MSVTDNQDLRKLMKSIDAEANKQVSGEDRAAFLLFLHSYYADKRQMALSGYSSKELVRLALEHWRWGRKRAAGKAQVRVYSQEGRAVSVVELVADDLPFLVTSINIAVRNAGHMVRWLLHPVVTAVRDKQGNLDVDAQGLPESWLRLEVDALADSQEEKALQKHIKSVLAELGVVVDDWDAMRQRALEVAGLLDGESGEEAAEAAEFLRWLEDNHFTFLGYRKQQLKTDKKGHANLVPAAGTALGLMRKALASTDQQGFVAPTELLDQYARSKQRLVLTKSQIKAWLHHDSRMDVVAIKEMDAQGEVIASHRFLGLFVSGVYSKNPTTIPLLQRKLIDVAERAQLGHSSYSAKSLKYILESYPRDELFQSDREDIFQTAMGILALRERSELGVFLRRDRYGRFYSALVFLPQDHYGAGLRRRMAQLLVDTLEGEDWDCRVDFMRRGLARLHFTIRTNPGSNVEVDVCALKEALQQVSLGWHERVREALQNLSPGKQSARLWKRFGDAFAEAYQDAIRPADAAKDIVALSGLSDTSPIALRTIALDTPQALAINLYSREQVVALSDVLPKLENFGLRVLSEEPYRVKIEGQPDSFIQMFELRHARGEDCATSPLRELFEEAFLRVNSGEIENDPLNALIFATGMTWQKVRLLRALCRYLVQTSISMSFSFMVRTLRDNAEVAEKLVELFEVRFGLGIKAAARKRDQQRIEAHIATLLERVPSLDADRVLRGLLSVIRACVRTNYYQLDASGQAKNYLSFKLRSAAIAELPAPRPLFETFVFSVETEGVHLRAAMVARGGLRWSDRRSDFRTEVLGLMKTQQVKNAIIVPEGAKGGFVVKRTPAGVTRRDQGIHCYQQFIRGLLDITDNRLKGKTVSPKQVVCHDADDTYLVVAADKGTAAFSDIANAESIAYGYWLGDAFASGGSHGYDHKKLGITARGGWESVKRHFAEMGHDTQSEPFTVVGIGDMAGDVFGNGMLLSRQIRLLAAFNHMHIFIDPDPDLEASFMERQRLFKLKGSAWTDYNTKLLSRGGGIYERSAKQIKLSAEARRALGITSDAKLTPNEVIQAILKSPADLLWNGGIGTYVRAAAESDVQVGDHANDSLRVSASELRCRVVGEGGNLGFTQKGRIEYARAGGRLNTDFVDNAAGVGSSDREVNIKIPLNELMLHGALKQPVRDKLLASMTRDLAHDVLEDNYDQTLMISLMEYDTSARLGEQIQLIRYLEHRGNLDRQIESMPDEEELSERRSKDNGLSRPELSVLMAYSKMKLYRELQSSTLVQDPFFEKMLFDYFPKGMHKGYSKALKSHSLRPDIIATRLTNDFVNHMGFTFPHRPSMDRGEYIARVTRAYVIADELLGFHDWWRKADKAPQLTLEQRYDQLVGLVFFLKRLIWWLLDNDDQFDSESIATTLKRYRSGVDELRTAIPKVLHGSYRTDYDERLAAFKQQSLPQALARSAAAIPAYKHLLDIVTLAHAEKIAAQPVANMYFALGERLHIPGLLAAIEKLHSTGRWQAEARSRLRKDVVSLHADLTKQLLDWSGERAGNPKKQVESWLAAGGGRSAFTLARLEELYSAGSVDFASLSVAVGELRSLL